MDTTLKATVKADFGRHLRESIMTDAVVCFVWDPATGRDVKPLRIEASSTGAVVTACPLVSVCSKSEPSDANPLRNLGRDKPNVIRVAEDGVPQRHSLQGQLGNGAGNATNGVLGQGATERALQQLSQRSDLDPAEPV